MTNILYIGKYNGIVGGIERYMQKSAELLRRNSFAVHYLYTENGGKEPESFANAFDTVQIFSPENNWLKNADMVIIHNIIGVEYLPFMPKKKDLLFRPRPQYLLSATPLLHPHRQNQLPPEI